MQGIFKIIKIIFFIGIKLEKCVFYGIIAKGRWFYFKFSEKCAVNQ
jgi:hypothetical protein